MQMCEFVPEDPAPEQGASWLRSDGLSIHPRSLETLPQTYLLRG